MASLQSTRPSFWGTNDRVAPPQKKTKKNTNLTVNLQVLAPGFRLGWASGPAPLVRALNGLAYCGSQVGSFHCQLYLAS